MEWNYKISQIQLGKAQHSKVYIIREYITGKEYIVKIYEDSKIIYYKNESNILDILNFMNLEEENIFFIMYKNMHYNQNMFQIPKEVKGFNLEFLFYDYLSKLSLLDYVNYFIETKKEIYAKYLCYKLLKAIDILQTSNICHNKIDVSNIMFDDNFTPKIIHFSEANIIDNKSQINKDIFGLGQILAKILTLGKFSSINYDKNKKVYVIYYKNQGKKAFIEESKFWKMIKILYDINVPKQFIDFFHIIIKAKKSKELININELLKDEWLNDVRDEIQIIENNFKKDLEELYKTIIDDYIKNSAINIDIKSILDENKEKDFLPIIDFYDSVRIERVINENNDIKMKDSMNKNELNEIKINKEIKEEPKNIEKNMKIMIEKNINEKSIEIDNKNKNEILKEENQKINKIEKIKEEEHKIKLLKEENLNKIRLNNEHNERIMKMEHNLNKSILQHEQEMKSNQKSKKEIIGIKLPEKSNLLNNNEKELDQEKKSLELEFELEMMKLKMNHEQEMQKIQNSYSYMMPPYNLEMNINNSNNHVLRGKNKMSISNKISEEREDFFKPRKDDFNYLKLNIKNNNNNDINKALNNFMKKLKDKTKQNYVYLNTKINFSEENVYSFKIIYIIEPTKDINFDDIEFLDDEYEKKIKKLQKFEIIVELIKIYFYKIKSMNII